jgi:transposase
MKRTSKLPMSLLPKVPGLKLEDVVIDAGSVSLVLVSTSLPVACPVCAQKTVSLHSHYWRTVADLPWSGRRVRLVLEVRKFRCPHRECPRRIFTERLPDLVEPYARKTVRLHEVLELVGFALGGEAGARLLRRLGMTASPTTLLRYIRNAVLGDYPAPEVIGVDDFSVRRGGRFGTIIVDLKRHLPIDLLPDRSASTLAAWLKAHPSAQTIGRDGSREYARGIAEGAPEAVEVLDRWHLLKNLREALERMLDRNQKVLSGIALSSSEHTDKTTGSPGTSDFTPPPRSPSERARSRTTRKRRYARYEKVRKLHSRGMSLHAIARKLGISRYAVRRYVNADTFPERRPHRRRPSMLDPFEPYLKKWWEEGCRNGMHLWRELCKQGYPGSRKRVAQWVQQRREEPASTTPKKYLSRSGGSPGGSGASRGSSPRQQVWLLLRKPEDLADDKREALKQMQGVCEDVVAAYPLAQQFVRMIRAREAEAFNPWLEAVEMSDVADLRSFASELRRERKAVEAALRLPYSNGQTEGQINKLKLIKRSMYGRANFDLLRQRFLNAG